MIVMTKGLSSNEQNFYYILYISYPWEFFDSQIGSLYHTIE